MKSEVIVSIIKRDVDVKASRRIRETVFIDEQQVPPEIEYDEYEESATHIIALLNGEAVGTARWRQTAEGHKLERFAVLKESRKHGVGAAMVNFILGQTNDGQMRYLNSQLSALEFYRSLGFSPTGPVFYEADIPHRKMIFEIRET